MKWIIAYFAVSLIVTALFCLFIRAGNPHRED